MRLPWVGSPQTAGVGAACRTHMRFFPLHQRTPGPASLPASSLNTGVRKPDGRARGLAGRRSKAKRMERRHRQSQLPQSRGSRNVLTEVFPPAIYSCLQAFPKCFGGGIMKPEEEEGGRQGQPQFPQPQFPCPHAPRLPVPTPALSPRPPLEPLHQLRRVLIASPFTFQPCCP